MFVAQGATFTLALTTGGGINAALTRLGVEAPTAEIVDMTPGGAPPGQMIIVPTGDTRGGTLSVDFIYAANGVDPQTLVGKTGIATFASPNLTVSRRVVVESASIEASVGDLVRGSINFRLTDYTGI
jgi:hypothetical protein